MCWRGKWGCDLWEGLGRVHRRMARRGYGLLKVLHGPTMSNPSMPCGWATPATACSTPLAPPSCRTPMLGRVGVEGIDDEITAFAFQLIATRPGCARRDPRIPDMRNGGSRKQRLHSSLSLLRTVFHGVSMDSRGVFEVFSECGTLFLLAAFCECQQRCFEIITASIL
jgi:hypothetical protein